MATVKVHEGESLDVAIGRFSRKVDKSGIIAEYKAKCAFKSKSARDREKMNQRNKKRTRKQNRA